MQEFDGSGVLARGTRLLQYRIERVLGRGGFGVVYKALDELNHFTTAIKEFFPLDQVFRDEDRTVKALAGVDECLLKWSIDTFLAEGRTLQRLHHGNIVRVRDSFESFGTGYIVMDFIPGWTLTHFLKIQGRRASAEDLVDLAVPLLDALNYMHVNGVMHCDIKPANILIRGDGSPALIDFGAAMDLRDPGIHNGATVNSSGYTAPEQVAGGRGLGPKGDLYSLAAVLYFAVAEHGPPDAAGRTTEDFIEPLAHRARTRREHAVFSVVDKALSITPEHRPETAREFCDELVAAADMPSACLSPTSQKACAHAWDSGGRR